MSARHTGQRGCSCTTLGSRLRMHSPAPLRSRRRSVCTPKRGACACRWMCRPCGSLTRTRCPRWGRCWRRCAPLTQRARAQRCARGVGRWDHGRACRALCSASVCGNRSGAAQAACCDSGSHRVRGPAVPIPLRATGCCVPQEDAWRSTALAPYITAWEAAFLAPLARDSKVRHRHKAPPTCCRRAGGCVPALARCIP